MTVAVRSSRSNDRHYWSTRGAWALEERLERAARVRLLTPDPFLAPDGSITHSIPLFGARNLLIGFACVTAVDLDRVRGYRWSPSVGGYIAASEMDGGTRRRVFLHRLVLGLAAGNSLQGDHINGDLWDCTRGNLRPLPQPHNAQNRKSHGPSPFRGVYRRKDPRAQRNPWVATVCIGGKQTTIGHFATEQEAAEAARSARRIHMPFAVERDGS